MFKIKPKIAKLSLSHKHYAIAIFSAATLLAGCQQTVALQETEQPTTTDPKVVSSKTDTDAETNVETQPPSNVPPKSSSPSPSETTKTMTAQEVTFKAVPFDYKMPKEVANSCDNVGEDAQVACSEIDIKLAKVEPKWIEDVINLEITGDNNPKYPKFKKELDKFAMSQIEDQSSLPYGLGSTPEQIKPHRNVAQFNVASYTYLGGAHGMSTIKYLLFDMDLQSQIGLQDVLIANGDIYTLAHDAFIRYLKTEVDLSTPEDIEDYEKMWTFTLTDNFYFGKQGLVLVYQPYEIGSYAQGYIELTIPYSELQGILSPEYMPK